MDRPPAPGQKIEELDQLGADVEAIRLAVDRRDPEIALHFQHSP